MKIYKETLRMEQREFKDKASYHGTMAASATKMAKLLISLDKSKPAEKYINIAKFHNSCKSFDIVPESDDDSSTSSSSSSSSSSSDSSSSSSSLSSSSGASSDEEDLHSI